jgi:hypothetical protein
MAAAAHPLQCAVQLKLRGPACEVALAKIAARYANVAMDSETCMDASSVLTTNSGNVAGIGAVLRSVVQDLCGSCLLLAANV